MKSIEQGLSVKQRKWLHCYCDSDNSTFGNATQSAIKAYGLDPETQYNSARTIGWENLTKLDIKITELMDKIGLTDVFLMSKLVEGLEAKRPYGKDSFLYVDNTSRLRALEIALKLKDKYCSDKDKNGFFSKDKLIIEIVDDDKKN